MAKFISGPLAYARAHKTMSIIATLVVIGGGYWYYHKTHVALVQPQYILTTVQKGTIISTISGSGQVSPSDQITVNPKASGSVTRVLVKEGQNVGAGQAIAYLDATDEYNSVQSAQANLKSAQISLQKLQQPPQQLSITQDQNAIANAQEQELNAKTNLAKDYSNGYGDVVSTFIDLPSIMSGLKDVVIGTSASHGTQWNIDYYKSAVINWDPTVSTYRDNAYAAYTKATASYTQALADYETTNTNSSTSTVGNMITESEAMTKDVQNALNAANTLIQFYESQIKNNNQTPVATADSALANLSTYISKVNTHTTSLLSDANGITSDTQSIADAGRTITQAQQSLQQLQAGADALDLQSSQLNVQQQENALAQAQQNLDNYTIRAPISGTIASLALHVGDTVGSGTAGATIITKQQLADLSLNEIDAAKVLAGQKATLTFDAIPDLTLTGTIASVSPLGTVTQGVVSYDIKIAFDTQDARVRAGMSVNADIQTAVHTDVLMVPASAVKTVNGATYVQLFDPVITGESASSTSAITTTQTPVNIPVTIGITDTTTTEIDSGVTEGQQIIRSTTSSSAAKTSAAATARGGFGGGGGALRGI